MIKLIKEARRTTFAKTVYISNKQLLQKHLQKWTSGCRIGRRLSRFSFSRHKLPFHFSSKRHAQYFVNSIEASVSIGFPPSRNSREN